MRHRIGLHHINKGKSGGLMALHRARSALPSFVCLFVCFAPFYRCRISNGVAEYCITSFLLSSSSLSSSSIVYLLPAALSEGWIPFCGSLKLGQPGSKFSHHSPTFARVLCCASSRLLSCPRIKRYDKNHLLPFVLLPPSLHPAASHLVG